MLIEQDAKKVKWDANLNTVEGLRGMLTMLNEVWR